MAVLCPLCNSINPSEAMECVNCSAKFPEVAGLASSRTPASSVQEEEENLRRILRLSRERARRRIAAREDPSNRGGEEADPKRKPESRSLETENLLGLEERLTEMESIHRQLVHTQEDELRMREASLRNRFDSLRRDLERREERLGEEVASLEREGEDLGVLRKKHEAENRKMASREKAIEARVTRTFAGGRKALDATRKVLARPGQASGQDKAAERERKKLAALRRGLESTRSNLEAREQAIAARADELRGRRDEVRRLREQVDALL